MDSAKRMLIFTGNRYVSAMLFHGYALPPWYDLPEIQQNPDYRETMTAKVNELIGRAADEGFDAFDIQEAFPVDLMEVDPRAEIIRGLDGILQERNYNAAAFCRCDFPNLAPQPRLQAVKKLELNGVRIDETGILCSYLESLGIQLYDGKAPEYVFPGEFSAEVISDINLKHADMYPGIGKVEPHAFTAQVDCPAKLLEFYRYLGIQIQSSNKY